MFTLYYLLAILITTAHVSTAFQNILNSSTSPNGSTSLHSTLNTSAIDAAVHKHVNFRRMGQICKEDSECSSNEHCYKAVPDMPGACAGKEDFSSSSSVTEHENDDGSKIWGMDLAWFIVMWICIILLCCSPCIIFGIMACCCGWGISKILESGKGSKGSKGKKAKTPSKKAKK